MCTVALNAPHNLRPRLLRSGAAAVLGRPLCRAELKRLWQLPLQQLALDAAAHRALRQDQERRQQLVRSSLAAFWRPDC